MDKIEFAERRYKQILPNPAKYVLDLRRLKIWLVDDVCPVIEEFVRRPKFRDYATWSIVVLKAGSKSPERREIDNTDDALARCAGAFTKLAAKPQIQSRLTKLYPPSRRAVRQVVEISGSGTRCLDQETGLRDSLSAELSQVATIARRPWKDLVAISDFLDPQQEYLLGDDGEWRQVADLIVALNPELHPVGNFVVRCMFQRFHRFLAPVRATRNKVARVVASSRRRNKEFDKADLLWNELQARYAALQKTHLTGIDNQLRDSCTILTQIYAAFHPAPELGWIPLSSEQIHSDIGRLRHRITNFQNGEMFDRIAAALGDLRRLYGDELPNQSAIDEAIAEGGLVVCAAKMEAFWAGKKIDGRWNRFKKPWELLTHLARRGGSGSDVTVSDLYGDKLVSDNALGSLVDRLKKLLPPSLRKWVIPGMSSKTYRLEIPDNRLHFFQ